MKRLIGLLTVLALMGLSTAVLAGKPTGDVPDPPPFDDVHPDYCDIYDSTPYWCPEWGLTPEGRGDVAQRMLPPVPDGLPFDDLDPPDYCDIFDSCPYWCPEWGIDILGRVMQIFDR